MFLEKAKEKDFTLLDRLYQYPILPRRDALSVLPKRSLLSLFKK